MILNFLYQEEEEEEEEEEQENGEKEEEESTEPPSNQTETHLNFTECRLSECQTADRDIRCRGIGMTHLPIIHNLDATTLDVAGVCVLQNELVCNYNLYNTMCFIFKENDISMIAAQEFLGLPNLETLNLSKNKLDDGSFNQSTLSVSNSTLCAYCQSSTSTAVLFFTVSINCLV